MARHDEREAIARAERTDRALRVRMPGKGGQLAVRDHLAVGNRTENARDGALERRAPVQVELSVAEFDPLPAEVPAKPIHERMARRQ